MQTTVTHSSACIIEHVTMIRIADGNGAETLCALTSHHEGDCIHCAITSRLQSHSPVPSVFIKAARYVKANLFANRQKDSIVWLDDPFEVAANRRILHGFEFVTGGNDGVITRRSVDLKTHDTWSIRVQLAVKLLLELEA